MDNILTFADFWKPAFFSFVIALTLILLAIKVFPKIGLMDRPHRYGLLRKPIPYYGGITIYLAFLLSVLIFIDLTIPVIGLLVGGTLIFLVGLLDDLISLNPFLRLIFQFLACLILVVSGIGILSINIPFFGVLKFDALVFDLPIAGFTFRLVLFSALFTVIWVMAILNTMNFIDGISGLSSGVSFIAGITVFVLSIHPWIHEDPLSQTGVATIALILASVSLAFLLFDFPKPKILMGDSGSTFLGFAIATLAIFSGGKVATAFLVLGIPILDMVWVVLRRTLSGRKFWQGDLKHLHHRLLNIGFSKRKVVLLYLLITALFGLFAISFVSSQQKFFILIALIVLMLLLMGALVFLPKNKV